MMRKSNFIPYQAFIVAITVLLLILSACGVAGRKTPAGDLDEKSSDITAPAQAETAPPVEQVGQIALNQGGDIYVMTVGGEGFQPLSGDLTMMASEEDERVRPLIGNDGVLRWDLTWSPDGSQLAFVSDSDDGDGYEIYVVEADGSSVRRLTHENHYNSSPAWSPDGNWMAFVDDSTIYVMDIEGSDVYRLTDEHWNDDPTWSPDGS
jgi:dipeptidyl aminopeptidase/acylaminoacyl peptidase